jgi:hemolysin III
LKADKKQGVVFMFTLFQRARDPISSYTHAIGAIVSALGTIFMLTYGLILKDTTPISLVGAVIFGLSMTALYSASSIYHYVDPTNVTRLLRLRKLDHAMIYVLIAGSYTPISLTFMNQPHGFYFIGILWVVAAGGIIIKLFWVKFPRWLSASLYLLMGWAAVFDYRAFKDIPVACLGLVAVGGIFYSIGAFVYIFKKPNYPKGWGFHEIFHLFILLGSLIHFLAVVLFVL